MFIYFSRVKLSRFVLIMVILFSIMTFFPIPFKNIAQDVVSVVAGNRLVPIYAVDTAEKTIAFSFDATWGNETLKHKII